MKEANSNNVKTLRQIASNFCGFVREAELYLDRFKIKHFLEKFELGCLWIIVVVAKEAPVGCAAHRRLFSRCL